LPWSGVGVEGRILQATKRWFASPFPALLPVLSCFFLDAIKETYNKDHIISFHLKKTPLTFVSCVLFCKKTWCSIQLQANEVKTPSKTPSAPTPAFSILISELQLQNITIKLLLFHLI
jgi:hypothetical protein